MLQFFDKIIGVLSSLNIPYMLSGSVAMSLYVVPRATRDFDFIIHLTPQDVARFTAHFQVGYYCHEESIKEAVRNPGMFNIIDHASGYKADFVVLKNEVYRQTEFDRRKAIDYFGKTIFVVSPEDLLLSKLIWIQSLQSAIQMDDIRNLMQIDELDWHYINDWAGKLNLNTFDLF
ncbi:hypothetical protein SAMN04487996_105141 [Dyadobacter soli]|uniref:Nucleotidyl transferase AbiEii toxin, Type IV TA system n=1 Tax=Dyadobacter soli TaxID=659014 RepID=A0A1G7D8A8_9BACT|nr:hypothetical protein [Dyadobacter soli]SDE47230.1 hypothetical protein SAMN04487996_105141 [Dyadobacter soli]